VFVTAVAGALSSISVMALVFVVVVGGYCGRVRALVFHSINILRGSFGTHATACLREGCAATALNLPLNEMIKLL
jgi:hypothetical protein